MRPDWRIGSFFTVNALLQGGGIYAADHNWLAAVPWILFISALGWCHQPLFTALYGIAQWLSRRLRLEHARRTILTALVSAAMGGPLAGPLAGLICRQLLSVHLSGLRSAEVGLAGCSMACGIYGGIVSIVMSRKLRRGGRSA